MKGGKILIVIILLIITSCKKSALDVDPNFVGSWFDGGSFYPDAVIIHSDGMGSFTRGWEPEEGYRHYQGKVTANKTHLKIGNSPNFTIMEFPTPIDTFYLNGTKVSWEMKRSFPDNIFYVLGEFTVYKL